MVTVQLFGGLGNQLFQYAAGRALALRTGSSLALDLTQCSAEAYRPYRLGLFHLEVQEAAPADIPFEFRHGSFLRRVALHVPQGLRWNRARVISERRFSVFNERVLQAPGDAYLAGYWQSPKYFADAAATIRVDLALTPEEAGADPSLLGEVSEDGTVSLHVRRGDYVSHHKTNELFGVCSPRYYKNAIDRLSAETDVRRVFVFSDDIDWAREELQFPVPTVFVSDPAGHSDIRDFFVMSQCQHHVLANSSFSWWAAWLGRCPDGRVVCPRPWFVDPGLDTKDLLPPEWLTI